MLNSPADMAKDSDKWHRNPMVWLVIAIPALTVAGCLLTIFLAIANPDQIETATPSAEHAQTGRPTK